MSRRRTDVPRHERLLPSRALRLQMRRRTPHPDASARHDRSLGDPHDGLRRKQASHSVAVRGGTPAPARTAATPKPATPKPATPKPATPQPAQPPEPDDLSPVAPVTAPALADRAPYSRRGRGLLLLTVGAIACVAVGGLGALLAGVGRSPGSPPHNNIPATSAPASQRAAPSLAGPGSTAVATGTSALTAAAQWAVSQLPSGSPVFSDRSTAELLTRLGHPAVQASVWSWRRADWVISTGRLRDQAPGSRPLTAALAATVPVAVFGRAGDRVVVARLLPGRVGSAHAAIAADARERRSAAAALLRNPRLRIAASARAMFTAGSVDLRAETLLAAIARSGSATVTRVVTDSAEQAAALPARRLTIAFPDPGTLSDALGSLPTRFRPYLVQGSNRLAQLTWRVRIPPVRPLR